LSPKPRGADTLCGVAAPVLKYDASGKLLASWGAGMFVFPHGATVDRDGNLWVTDARGENGKGHQVFKFSPAGAVLMTLGKAGVSGGGRDLFDQPTDVVVSPAGDVFVTDSHRNGRNNRVVRFTKDGAFVNEWGRKGSGRGEFSEPHAIAMDSRGRLFVGDRENNRIQIFDQNGTFLDERGHRAVLCASDPDAFLDPWQFVRAGGRCRRRRLGQCIRWGCQTSDARATHAEIVRIGELVNS
jgi:hypothetical protein